MSYNLHMERVDLKTALTNEDEGVYLNAGEIEEYRAYKRRRSLNAIAAAISASEASVLGSEDVQRTCERAVRLRQAAIQTPLSKLRQAAYYLSGSGVRLDCVIGGTGETLPKVKAYEAQLARRRHADEITVVVTPSFIDCCRYGEVEKELKRVKRAIGRALLKVRVEQTYPSHALGKLAQIASSVRARYFSVPYHTGCEKFRQQLSLGCRLEVSGVNTLADYQSLRAAGVSRIITDYAWEFYTEWVRISNEEDFSAAQPKKQEKTENEPPMDELKPRERDEERDYQCYLDGDKLKFL